MALVPLWGELTSSADDVGTFVFIVNMCHFTQIDARSYEVCMQLSNLGLYSQGSCAFLGMILTCPIWCESLLSSRSAIKTTRAV